MKPKENDLVSWCKNLFKTSFLAILLISLSLGLSGAGWNWQNESALLISKLPAKDAITDPQAILRYALPIDNDTIRKVQGDLEDISKQARAKRWLSIGRDVKSASNILENRSDKIFASIPDASKEKAQTLLNQLKDDAVQLQTATEAKDREAILEVRKKMLAAVGDLEALMITKFPFEIPSEYSNLPQLLGRATIEMETTKGNLTIVVDGYSAPINAGNFVDLVQRGFYNGLDFSRGGDDFVIQSGDPKGEEDGFVDPKTGKYRSIPMEVLIDEEPLPIYGNTLEDLGIYLANLALPFNAYGAVGLARPADDPNGGSSQFFFFKFDTELTPPGFNLMDGRYSVFGYVVDGKEVLEELTAKDKIISAKVVNGLENLVQPQA
jgi:peptidylprolyl isomerase